MKIIPRTNPSQDTRFDSSLNQFSRLYMKPAINLLLSFAFTGIEPLHIAVLLTMHPQSTCISRLFISDYSLLKYLHASNLLVLQRNSHINTCIELDHGCTSTSILVQNNSHVHDIGCWSFHLCTSNDHIIHFKINPTKKVHLPATSFSALHSIGESFSYCK